VALVTETVNAESIVIVTNRISKASQSSYRWYRDSHVLLSSAVAGGSKLTRRRGTSEQPLIWTRGRRLLMQAMMPDLSIPTPSRRLFRAYFRQDNGV
jgi:hypothetical protein